MAFTRKKATKAAPARASYAKRKMKEQEEEVQEEIIEEEAEQEQEQDDYQEETPAPRSGYTRQVRRMQTQGTSYGNRSTRGNNGGQGERKALRLTGLFAGKREGLYSGRLRDEDAENLKALIEEAQSEGQQISFFLWENQGNPQFSLTANIAVQKSFGGRSGGFRRGGFNR